MNEAKSRLRISVVSLMEGNIWGGCEELWGEMARAAIAEGHEVHASCREGELHPKLRKLQELGVRLHRRPLEQPPVPPTIAQRIHRRVLRSLGLKPWNPFDSIFDIEPDLVFINLGILPQIAWRWQLRDRLALYRGPVFAACHSERPYPYAIDNTGALVREWYPRLRRLFFASRRNMEDARRYYLCPFDNFEMVRCPANIADTSALPWPGDGNPPTFAAVGRLELEHKGWDLLLQGLADSSFRHEPWRLEIYGLGPHEGYLRELAEFLGIADRVRFAGHVDDVRDIWRNAHMLCLPSRVEAFPLVMVEAMICGRPVLGTDIGDITTLVREGETGFLVPAPTPDLVRQGLERAWAARDRWPELGRNARQAATDWYDPHAGRTFLHRLIELSA